MRRAATAGLLLAGVRRAAADPRRIVPSVHLSARHGGHGYLPTIASRYGNWPADLRRIHSERPRKTLATATATATATLDGDSPSKTSDSKPITRPVRGQSLLTLAIETSCDDTCVAVLEKHGNTARLLFNEKVTSDNRAFGGIEPITAVASHEAQLATLVDRALQVLPRPPPNRKDDYKRQIVVHGSTRRKPDFISVTRGPGMTSALSVGLNTAKGLAVAWQVPLVAVHHMQAHALTPRLVVALEQRRAEHAEVHRNKKLTILQPRFPFLSLLVSGGHTQLVSSRSAISHTIVAESLNVALGDMLDKCARAILPANVIAEAGNVMFGALLEQFAFPHVVIPRPTPPSFDVYATVHGYMYNPPTRRADEIKPYVSPTYGWSLTPPLAERRDMAYDFSGLGGQVQAIMQKNPDMDVRQRQVLARETMRIAFEHLAGRVVLHLEEIDAKRREQGDKPMATTTTQSDENTSEEPTVAEEEQQQAQQEQGEGQMTITTTTPEDSDGANTESAVVEQEQQEQQEQQQKEQGEMTTTTTTPESSDSAGEETTVAEKDQQEQHLAGREPNGKRPYHTLVISGGVASNRFLKYVVWKMLEARGYGDDKLLIRRPPINLCTDNAAMVAWAGMEMFEWEAGGWHSELSVTPVRKWSMADASRKEGSLSSGILGAGGWRSWRARQSLWSEAEKKTRAVKLNPKTSSSGGNSQGRNTQSRSTRARDPRVKKSVSGAAEEGEKVVQRDAAVETGAMGNQIEEDVGKCLGDRMEETVSGEAART